MNIIILTTAITRGDFHKKSIGKFYELYSDALKAFTIHHIINLDCPTKLASTFTKKQTIDLFDEIIPKTVNTIIIDNENPGFLNAHKNVVRKANELNIINEKTIIWWFEDDWDVSNFNKELFDIIQLFPFSQPYAFNSVQSSPLGSFRGGPIMNALYFKQYFDIVSNNMANDTCDPEKQVGRWISGINKQNGNQLIHRTIENDNTINIIFFYHNTNKINLNDFPHSYYARKDKYNEKLKFNYHAIKSQDLNTFYYGKVDIQNANIDFAEMSIGEIHNILNNNGINYVCIKPWTFSDIGRIFNANHSLNKWATINDGTSYI
jgi:hypothetical protein